MLLREKGHQELSAHIFHGIQPWPRPAFPASSLPPSCTQPSRPSASSQRSPGPFTLDILPWPRFYVQGPPPTATAAGMISKGAVEIVSLPAGLFLFHPLGQTAQVQGGAVGG